MNKILRVQKNKGMIVMLSSLLFIAILSAILFGISTIIVSRYSSARSFSMSKQAYMTAHSAAGEAYYRLKTGLIMPDTLTVTLGSAYADIVVTDIPGGKSVRVDADADSFKRKIVVEVVEGTGISFHYGIQAGRGGFEMQNSSSVSGNVYSDGPIIGTGNYIYGDAISSGPTGLIDGIHATGTAYAHTIRDSIIDKDAYYMNVSGTTASGSPCPNPHCFPNSPDNPTVPLPISDDQIYDWENQAANGGSLACSGGKLSITSSRELGPAKIPCDLEISGTPTVTIKGHIWVEGNITIQNSSILKMDPNLGNQNVAIIADKSTDRLTGSTIKIKNSSTFQDSGTPGSFVFLISMNNSAQNGGSVNAIELANSTRALVAYASHGLIPLENSVSLKEVTAYKITLKNSANVRYDTGLPNTLFSAGPGGGYDILNWLEI